MTDCFAIPNVAACRLERAEYPAPPPFHPSTAHPEYALESLSPRNLVYDGVRALFHSLGLDRLAYGTPAWNPLGVIVQPGDKVILKPNLFWHSHRYNQQEFEPIITHGSIIRAVLDYVLIALQGRGEIWVADGPQLDADWNLIMERTGVNRICSWYQSRTPVRVHFLDLRDQWEDVRGEVLYGTNTLPGDPAGSTEVNLGPVSRFFGHRGAGKYYGATYDQVETNYHHSGVRQEYRISRTVASADVFINLPKVKTHKKTGITLSLKNLVGINTGRNWLPHHTDGDPSNGGDQFPVSSVKNDSERKGIRVLERLTLANPRLFAPLFRLAKTVSRPLFGHTRQTVRSGNWHGNDTCWRMVHDINRALLYSNGIDFPTPKPKRFFSVVDGVVSGDADGPAAPDTVPSGFLVAGFNPVSVDCAVTRLVGFDPMKIPMLREAFEPSDLPLAPFAYSDITIVGNCPEWRGKVAELSGEHTCHFKPHFGWKDHIEWIPGQASSGRP